MKKSSLLFVIFFLFSSTVFAQNFGANSGTIIQKIATGNGPLTRAEYDEFWQAIGITNRTDKQRMVTSMRAGFLLTQEYQKEVWICIEQSWISRSPSKCEKAQKKMNAMKASLNEDQKIAVNSLEESSNRMIQAAARREDFRISSDAAPIKLSVENARLIRQNLEKMLVRLEAALRVDFN
jgi:hypothetical protein